MDIAFAADSTSGGFVAFIPLVMLGCILGALLMSIAKRKGKSPILWFIAGFAFGLNIYLGLWLASLPDKSVTEKLEALSREKLKQQESDNSVAMKKNWTCNCGQVNDMTLSNCPDCGLKRDFLLKRSAQNSA